MTFVVRLVRAGAMLIVVALPACAGNLSPNTDDLTTNAGFSREVRFERSELLFRDPPDCVIVLPNQSQVKFDIGGLLERGVARRLSEKVGRVIGQHERKKLERKLNIDFSDKVGRAQFATITRCRFFLKISVAELENRYLLVWSRRSLNIALEIIRASDARFLWGARHIAMRSQGGLPLSPVSVAVNSVYAGTHQADTDIIPSLIDDALRRMFVTLPDFRR